MNEKAEQRRPDTIPTPKDLAKKMGLRGVDLVSSEADSPELEQETAEQKAGDSIERDGKEYVLVPVFYTTEKWEDGHFVRCRVPHTYRQYYSHSFQDPNDVSHMIPAPGWDSRYSLADEDHAQALHGRTFSDEELKDLPKNLPDTDCLFVCELGSPLVEEYAQYLDDISSDSL